MKEICLTRGKKTVVDDEMYDSLVAMGKWMCITGNGGDYAAKNKSRPDKRAGKGDTIFMHHIVMGIEERYRVDHIDRDGLNNQKSNLRNATLSQQQANQVIGRNNKSGYKGVSRDSSRGKWFADIVCNKKHQHLGRFNTAEEAAEGYNKAAKELYGEFAVLNTVKL